MNGEQRVELPLDVLDHLLLGPARAARRLAQLAQLGGMGRQQAVLGQEVADVLLSRIALDRTAPHPFPRLSDREREVLDLLVAGRRTSEIAAALFVSPKTVSNQLTSIYGKLGVADRTQAILVAREKGLPFR